ncbi:MAG: hypothetical protein RR475_02275 [Clostridia bacterium]
MLQLTIPDSELWDEGKQEFVNVKGCSIQLEHSLVSLSKWESEWNRAFLSKPERTEEEMLDYIKFMTITQNVDPETYKRLSNENIEAINQYIEAPMTATYFSKDDRGERSRELVTAEIIYYWMIDLHIPFECQKWHLNRLLTLIRVCDIKNRKPKKRSRKETFDNNAKLNAARKAQFNSRG